MFKLSIPLSNSVRKAGRKLLLDLKLNTAGTLFEGGVSSKLECGPRKETEWKTVKVKYNI